MVGGARSATHFIVSPSAWHPPHMHTHTQCTSTHTGCMGAHTHTHTHQGFTSTQTQTDIAPAVSPQGVNINICPCHTHKGEGCRLVRPHVWQRAGSKMWENSLLLFLFFWFPDFFFFFFQKVATGFYNRDFWQTFSALSAACDTSSQPLCSLSSL